MAVIVAMALTPLARRLAHACGVIDRPTSSVKTHVRAMPYLGGTSIFLAFNVGIAVDFVFRGQLCVPPGIVFGGWLISGVGLWDDVFQVRVRTRILWQVVAVVVAVANGAIVHLTGVIWVDVPFTIFGLVGLINAFNLVDIMDGLAAGLAAVAGLGLLLLSTLVSSSAVAIPAVLIAGAALGFLVYNRPPASIFMGDCGSTLLGYVLGVLAVILSNELGPVPIDRIMPAIVLALPIYETLFTMAVRLKNGRAPFRGSRDHVPLRLVALGLTRGQTVLYSYVVAAVLALGGFIALQISDAMATALLISLVLGALILGHILSLIHAEPIQVTPVRDASLAGAMTADQRSPQRETKRAVLAGNPTDNQ